MIPKVIHYCWFSGERKPALVRRCVDSWRRNCSGWEIREWDIMGIEGLTGSSGALPEFVSEALAARKWAFASDWARFAIIAACGGVYLDSDVELVSSIDDLIEAGPFFACSSDNPPWVDPGLGFAAERGDVVCAAIARKYESLTFDPACHLSQTCPEIANDVIRQYGDRRLLPAAAFNPKGGCSGRVVVTSETRAIHHFAASWFNWRQKLVYKILPRMGIDVSPLVRKLRGL